MEVFCVIIPYPGGAHVLSHGGHGSPEPFPSPFWGWLKWQLVTRENQLVTPADTHRSGNDQNYCYICWGDYTTPINPSYVGGTAIFKCRFQMLDLGESSLIWGSGSSQVTKFMAKQMNPEIRDASNPISDDWDGLCLWFWFPGLFISARIPIEDFPRKESQHIHLGFGACADVPYPLVVSNHGNSWTVTTCHTYSSQAFWDVFLNVHPRCWIACWSDWRHWHGKSPRDKYGSPLINFTPLDVEHQYLERLGARAAVGIIPNGAEN